MRQYLTNEISDEMVANIIQENPYDESQTWLLMGLTDSEADDVVQNYTSKQDAIETFKSIRNQKSHWGSDFDTSLFQKLFDVGVIIFKDNNELYRWQTNTNFEYYILIYNEEELHFQVAGLYNSQFNSVTSAFKKDDLPQWFQNQFEGMY